MHECAITAITVIRRPVLDSEGFDNLNSEPTCIATSSLDGGTKLVDLRDTANISAFGHERGELECADQ